MGKNVFFFSKELTDGNATMKELLGGKGANLAEMSELGIPVPPGFTITTEVCGYYADHDSTYPEGLRDEVSDNLKKLEAATGKTFGSLDNPLLVSVRSGAFVSMPGMMDTILNLGLTDETVAGLAVKSGNERFAYDSYRRLLQMYGDVVMDLKPETESDHDPFEEILESLKEEKKVELDTDLSADDLKVLVARFKAVIERKAGRPFPQDPTDQLWGAIEAVFRSWNNPRAIKYRQINDIKGLLGTAVNVQAMVFGNMGDGCGTGVAFTRDPATGLNEFYGEYLMNAQGEDVVAGIRTPQPISTLNDEMPGIYGELIDIRAKLEAHYKDMQDIEFTIEDGVLYMLQTRTGKRTAAAAIRTAVEMVDEGMIDKKEALLRVAPEQIDQLLHPMFDPAAEAQAPVLAKGLPASPGGASGAVVFSAEAAEAAAEAGKKVILVRIETSPEDIGGMVAAQGILTARGGMTSHAAVVARGMGKCCVAGAGELAIDYANGQFTVGGQVVKAGESISLNGSSGVVYKGDIKTIEPEVSGNFGTLLGWADEFRTLGVRTNADTPFDTAVAVKFGAEGIGLTRTEHMFFEGDRIVAVREMILAEDEAGRREPLAKLLPMQRGDFEGIFKALEGLPATIRLLDPPLHEFLPHDAEGQEDVAKVMGLAADVIRDKVESLHEFNPMLGHRGCRLGIIYPEISEMQVRAIMEAACNVHKSGTSVKPEIMIPLVGHVKELALQRELAVQVAEEVLAANGLTKADIPYLVGTMIEVPRAAVTADEIATEAEFFSFGTNDLTQMGCGFSRDDAGKFLKDYVELGIYEKDPFAVLDQAGIGKLVAMACELGRKARPDIKLGICGEHGGEPSSVAFCHKVGLNYVSCSPYRVPVARLAAAQAAIKA
ncbi:pyruvate, phosphate dikinase [Candidatus Bipolaricaulota bacterium]